MAPTREVAAPVTTATRWYCANFVIRELTDQGQFNLGRRCVSRLIKWQDFTENDLMCVTNSMLFWGAGNVDDRDFEKPENRATSLQISMVRK